MREPESRGARRIVERPPEAGGTPGHRQIRAECPSHCVYLDEVMRDDGVEVPGPIGSLHRENIFGGTVAVVRGAGIDMPRVSQTRCARAVLPAALAEARLPCAALNTARVLAAGIWQAEATEQGGWVVIVVQRLGVGRAGAGGFRVFVAARSAALVRSAWLLTGDEGQAQDLVQAALAKTWSRWGRAVRQDAPEAEAYVRRVMLSTYLTWTRRRWRGERAPALVSERVSVAPKEPVLSTPIASTWPCERIQASRLTYPGSLAGNS
jgi:hypothetical protein